MPAERQWPLTTLRRTNDRSKFDAGGRAVAPTSSLVEIVLQVASCRLRYLETVRPATLATQLPTPPILVDQTVSEKGRTVRKQTIRWIIAWAILVLAVVIAFLVSRYVQLSQLVSLLGLVAAALTLIAVRPIMKRFPRERRINIDGRWIGRFQGYLVPCGAAAIVISFVWMIAFSRIVPDNTMGIAILAIPSFSLVILGVVAIAFRVFVWFLGE